jgi:replicative DNA helicase
MKIAGYETEDLPRDDAAEAIVLAAALRSPERLTEALAYEMGAFDFYSVQNRQIFQTLVLCRQNGADFWSADSQNTLGAAARLKARSLLEDLSGQSVPDGLYVNSVRSTMRKRVLRSIYRLIALSPKISSLSSRRHVAAELLRKLREFDGSRSPSTTKDIKGYVMDALEKVEIAYETNLRIRDPLQPTGFPRLDSTKWLAPGNLVLIGAPRKAGSTAFAVALVRARGLRSKEPLAYFSSAESGVSVVERLFSRETCVDLTRLREGQLVEQDFSVLTGAASRLADTNIRIRNARGLTPLALWAEARRLKRDHGVSLIIIDRLDLCTGGSRLASPPAAPESHIWAAALKGIAEDLDLAIVVMTHVARSKRKDSLVPRIRRPLREIADVIMLLSRPFPSTERVERLRLYVELKQEPFGIIWLAFDNDRGVLGEVDMPMETVPLPAPADL